MNEQTQEPIASLTFERGRHLSHDREHKNCHICRVHRLRNPLMLEFTLKVVIHNEGFTCHCISKAYCKECFEAWLTFFRGVCPLCLRYKKLPPTQSKIIIKKDLKCFICEERKNFTSGGILLAIPDTREKDAPKCTCDPIPLHPKCEKKWIDNCGSVCPKCFLQC